jgi:2-polyprenyl-3-methyl-5-hydroxy-6-metoxy-1,4-benzoquinol methylase
VFSKPSLLSSSLHGVTENVLNLMDGLSFSKDMPILDVGCGAGRLPLLLSRKYSNVIGTDLSSKAIQQALKLSKRYGLNASFVVADAYFLPFKAGAFKTIICSEVIEHLQESSAVLKEFYRVIHDEGTLLISTPNPLAPYYLLETILKDLFNSIIPKQPVEVFLSPQKLRNIVLESGFSISRLCGSHLRSFLLWSKNTPKYIPIVKHFYKISSHPESVDPETKEELYLLNKTKLYRFPILLCMEIYLMCHKISK